MTMPGRIQQGLWWDRALGLVGGCSHDSPACRECWLEFETYMRSHQKNAKMQARYGGLTDDKGKWTGAIRLNVGDLERPRRRRIPTTYAIWSDLFHEDVPVEFVARAFEMMSECQHHRFMVLTKRAKRMSEVLGGAVWWAGSAIEHRVNVGLGVTVEHPDYLWRVEELVKTPAAFRFISAEPLLAAVDFSPHLRRIDLAGRDLTGLPGLWDESDTMPIHLVIGGCESGHRRRVSEIDWFRHLREQCREAGAAYFLKQIEVGGKVVKAPHLDGRQWLGLPDILTTGNAETTKA